MSIRRVVPDIESGQMQKSAEFYTDVLGFRKSMDLDWVVTFTSPTNPTAQITLIRQDPSGLLPDMTVEVDDVNAIHTRATERGYDIVYGITDEPWGVRRFFVREPNGKLINIMSHTGREAKAGDG